MSSQSSTADDTLWTGSVAQIPTSKPDEVDLDEGSASLPGIAHFIPTVFWTTWPVPKRLGSMIVYQSAVTSDGTAQSIIRSDDVLLDQASDFSCAIKLSEELKTAMETVIEDKSKRLRGATTAEGLKLLLSSQEAHLASSDTTSFFDTALRDLVASNSEHTNSRYHWLDPIALSHTFPKLFKDFKPDYSGLRSIGDGDPQPAHESSDADPHMDDSPKARFLNDLKKISIDTPDRSCVPS